MQIRIDAVHPGAPTMVDTVVAGVGVRAEWIGTAPTTGKIVDVELDIEPVLRWHDTIRTDSSEATLPKQPLLHGTVDMQEREILTLRIAEGLLQVEIDDPSIEVPPGTAIAIVAEQLKLYPTGM